MPLHTAVEKHPCTLQLIAPRKTPGTGTTARSLIPHACAPIELLEGGNPFGPELYKNRTAIERDFARLTNCPVGLKGLPNGARTRPRVRRWVQVKIILVALHVKHFAQ